MTEDVLNLDATSLGREIASGQISSLAATEAFIEHIKHVNGNLNCMVEDRFEQARAEARECDRQLQTGRTTGRLFGVPMSMKECFDVVGMKTTGGLLQKKDHIATQDAEVVQKLRAEGAVILGKTNTPTLCFCQESDNKLYGRTNNPWNTKCTCGGSSGGEGALVAVGGAAVGLGSDIGGSIRFPAHFNGVIGFKSGCQQVSQVGHFPYVENELQHRMLGIGAIAKSVSDAELVNEIIANQTYHGIDSSRIQIDVPPVHKLYPLGTETRQYMESLTQFLSSQFPIHHDFPPIFQQVARIWQQIMSIDGAAGIVNAAFGSRSNHAFREYFKERLTGNSDFHSYLSWALIGASLFRPSKSQLRNIYSTLSHAKNQCDKYFHNCVLVLPVYHRCAPLHGKMYQELFSVRKTYLKYMPYTAFANTLGLPALVIPVGTARNGMPFAVQLVSKAGNEKALFDVGRMLENQFRGYVRCTKYDRGNPSAN